MKHGFLSGRLLNCLAIVTLALSCQSPSPTTTAVPNALETPPTRLAAVQTPVSPLVPGHSLPGETPSTDLEHSPVDPTDWAIYRGWDEYRPELPPYEIRYDLKVWSLVDEQTIEPRLVHREIPNCSLRLLAGPIGAATYATVRLAGREWGMAINQGSSLHYWTQYQNGTFILVVGLPEEFSPANKSLCQIEAEGVIDTFSIVEE
jgi:hypothetical protein